MTVIPYVQNSTWVDNTTPRSAARLGVIEQGIYDAHYMPAARATNASWNIQNLAISTWGVFTFTSAVFDQVSGVASSHWSAGQPTRLTAQYPGKYVVTVENADTQGTGVLAYLAIRVNGTTLNASRTCSSPNKFYSVATQVTLAANDYVEAAIYNGHASYQLSVSLASMALARVA